MSTQTTHKMNLRARKPKSQDSIEPLPKVTRRKKVAIRKLTNRNDQNDEKGGLYQKKEEEEEEEEEPNLPMKNLPNTNQISNNLNLISTPKANLNTSAKSSILPLKTSKKRPITEALDDSDIFENGQKDSPIVLKNLRIDKEKSKQAAATEKAAAAAAKEVIKAGEKSPLSKRIDRLKGSVSPSMVKLTEKVKAGEKGESGSSKKQLKGQLESQEVSSDTSQSPLFELKRNLSSAIEKIEFTNAKWSNIVSQPDENRPEDATNEINSNIGKFNLILTSKFKQFRMLINKVDHNLEHDGQLMSANDLIGIWDNIEIQIEGLFGKFLELEVWKGREWKVMESFGEETSTGKGKRINLKSKDPNGQKNITKNTSSKSLEKRKEEAKRKQRIKAREQATRERLAAMKKSMLEKKKKEMLKKDEEKNEENTDQLENTETQAKENEVNKGKEAAADGENIRKDGLVKDEESKGENIVMMVV